MNFGFYAMLFRMKYINRWGIMHSLVTENLSAHSLEVAFISHALALIGNTYFGADYSADTIAVKAMFHDSPEIFTGDQPTPVKYFSSQTKSAYTSVEDAAIEKLLNMLPEELKAPYSEVMTISESEKKLIKAADKICAYLKCLEETRLGNSEFAIARDTLLASVGNSDCREAEFFMKNCIDAFGCPIDTLLTDTGNA